MNFYNKESNILEYIQECNPSEIVKVFSSSKLNHLLYSLKNEKMSKYWIDSSGGRKLPPDFYNDKLKLMLEVMRVDDYVHNKNCPNALETKMIRELENIQIEKGLPTFEEQNIKLLVIPDMKNASEHNYNNYVENFNKTVRKHIKKIPNYRNNHPNYKLGFIIFDESTGYIIPKDYAEYKNINYGDPILAYLHFYWLDKNLIDAFIDEDLDYVIWVTPYKNIAENGQLIPSIFLIDIKKYRKKYYKKTVDYSNQYVTSIEKF